MQPTKAPQALQKSHKLQKPKVFFKTFGCRTNIYDTQIMRENLRDFDCTQEEQDADIIIVNSCTVTNGADSGVRSYVRRVNELGKQVVFTGCGVKTQGKALYASGLVSGVLGHSHKERINAALKNLRLESSLRESSAPESSPLESNLRESNLPDSNPLDSNLPESSHALDSSPASPKSPATKALDSRFFYDDDLESGHVDSTIISEFVGKSRAFIKIQEGCDFACSYCIIPSVRGRSRSLPASQIIEQVKVLLDSGVSEIVLTGTNVGSYGKSPATPSQSPKLAISATPAQSPNPPQLAALLEQLFALDGLRRVRIGSLEPGQITEQLFALLSHPKLERHLHIALQHTHDRMLELMNRHNRFASDYELLHKIAALGYAIGTDFIVGHPGESEQIWQEAFANLATLPLTHIHPFIYSVRDGTASASMRPVVNGAIAKQRLHALSTHIAESNLRFRQNIRAKNAPLQVLVEKQLGSVLVGLDQYYNKIFIDSSGAFGGDAQMDSVVDSGTESTSSHQKPESSPKSSPDTAQESARNLWLEITSYEVQKEHNHAKI